MLENRLKAAGVLSTDYSVIRDLLTPRTRLPSLSDADHVADVGGGENHGVAKDDRNDALR